MVTVKEIEALKDIQVQRAEDLALRIASELEGQTEITRGAVLTTLGEFNREIEQTQRPNIRQVCDALFELGIRVVEEVRQVRGRVSGVIE